MAGFPGIPEEVMLTLAQGKPVYLAGAFGGGAADVGSLLGLAHPRRGDVPLSLQAEPSEAEGQSLEDCRQAPARPMDGPSDQGGRTRPVSQGTRARRPQMAR